jgi:hypothetical protein
VPRIDDTWVRSGPPREADEEEEERASWLHLRRRRNTLALLFGLDD